MSMSESTGAQDWRAVACLAPGGERLLCVGESSSQVRAAYAGAWGEVIRDEDRPTVRAISLQRWAGQAWAGQWEHQTYLAVPATRGGKAGPAKSTRPAPPTLRLRLHPWLFGFDRTNGSKADSHVDSLPPGCPGGSFSRQEWRVAKVGFRPWQD